VALRPQPRQAAASPLQRASVRAFTSLA